MELMFYLPLGISHICPVYPSAHTQKNPVPIMGDARGDDTHVAPFKQGLRAHGEPATIKNE